MPRRRARLPFRAIGWNIDDPRVRFLIGSFATFEEALDACEEWVIERCSFHTIEQHRAQLKNHFGFRTAVIGDKRDPR